MDRAGSLGHEPGGGFWGGRARVEDDLRHIHRPATLTEWIDAETLDQWMKRLHAEGSCLYTAADDTKPASLRIRLQTMPPLEHGTLYANQIEAVTNLEHSLKRNRPRALIVDDRPQGSVELGGGTSRTNPKVD